MCSSRFFLSPPYTILLIEDVIDELLLGML